MTIDRNDGNPDEVLKDINGQNVVWEQVHANIVDGNHCILKLKNVSKIKTRSKTEIIGKHHY